MKTAIKIALAAVLGAGVTQASPLMAQQLMQDAAIAAVGTAATMQVAAQGKAVESQAKSLNEKQSALADAMDKNVNAQPARQAVPLDDHKTVMPQKDEALLGSSISLSASGSSAASTFAGVPGGSMEKANKDELSSPKVPDSIKGVIKRLNTATENVTLEDLNSAREAVAKLDILIDIEKRLNDLSDLRHDREEKSLASAIPASALGLRGQAGGIPAFTPPGIQPGMTQGMPPVTMMPPASNVEVQRITGAGGRFSAMIKSGEGKSTLVREGDKLPDGSIVKDITSRGLTLLRGKDRRTVQVKDVAAVFNGR